MKKRVITSDMDFGTLIIASLMFVIMVFGTIYGIIVGASHFWLYGLFAWGAFSIARYAWLEGTKVITRIQKDANA